MTSMLFYSTMISTLLILIAPIITSMFITQASGYFTQTTKLACLTSLIPTNIFINYGMQTTMTNATWLQTSFNINISFLFDIYSTTFMTTALFITWAILEFSDWYMKLDPNKNKFMKYLMLFLLAMMTMTTANSLLQLFVGWEGVGIMSFLLIGWWHGRTNANTSALQAVMYNRIGDIGLILSLAWFAMHYNTWDVQQTFSHTTPPTLPLLGLVLAAMGKSAQFGLHPWLPAAMEGPTPVSALLHSSTMVVAGIFLLARLFPMMQNSQATTTLCLCLGAMTTTFAALCALTQNDIKKIIAFSTSSQLGLMMLTLGLNQPQLTYLHITTHAFFKAMLFLCAGSVIHNLGDEQDIRKMGSTQKTMPLTTTCMTIGNLALTGAPFLAGFYTKDVIIETMNTSHLNAWALSTTIIATALTAAYSLRLTFYVQTNKPRYNTTTTPAETNPSQTRPLVRLAMGSIMSGLFVATTMLPTPPQTMTMGPITKLAATIITLVGLLCAMDITMQTSNLLKPKQSTPSTSSTQLGFFNTLAHRAQPKYNMQFGQNTAMHLNDLIWYEAIAPKTAMLINTALAKKLSKSHTGHIKTYLVMLIATLAAAITTYY